MRASPIQSARRADPVELLLGRPPLSFADFVEAGGYEFDRYFVDSAGAISPFAPGDRRKYAVQFAEMECPKALRIAAVAASRGEAAEMFDATDLEIARRAHDYEMGAESKSNRAWSRFYKQAEAAIIDSGWDGRFNNGKSRGLDGAELPGDDDGYSIDGAYDAFEKGWTVERYINSVRVRRAELGL